MKKFIVFILAMVFTAGAIKAQNVVLSDSRNSISFGVKAGANYSNAYNSNGDAFNATAKYGFAGGVFLAIPLGQYLGIQPEVLFSQKGFKATGNLLGTGYDLTRTTNYIDVPLLIAIKPIPYVTIVAGPHYSYLLSQKDAFANGTTTIDQENTFENANVRKNVFGIIVGLDVNIQQFVLSARGGWDLYNNNGDGTNTTPTYRNAWAQATVGLRIF